MTYAYFDWRYPLPCEKRIHREVRDSLEGWFVDLLDSDVNTVRKMLSKRWKDISRPLVPLRKVILQGGKPAITGRLGENFLTLTLGAQGKDPDCPWIPKTWSTPTKFFPDKARNSLAKERVFSKEELAKMPDDHVQHLAYQHFEVQLSFQHYRRGEQDEEPWEWTIYIPPPIEGASVADGLRKHAFKPGGLLEEFLRAFDGFRESDPGLAGGFIPLRQWIRTEQDRERSKYSWYDHLPEAQQREWKDAIILFHARNGDQVVLHPDERAGWMLHEEARIEPKWPSFEAFIAGYVDALEYRWPFDGYGPSTEAIEARKARSSRPSRP